MVRFEGYSEGTETPIFDMFGYANPELDVMK